MIKKLIHIWQKLSNSGIRPEHTFEDIKRIRIINQASIIGLTNTLLYAIILISLSFSKIIKLDIELPLLFKIGFLLTISLFGLLTFVILRKYGYKVAGFFQLIAFPTLMLTLNIALDKSGTEFYDFAFFILAFYLLRQRRGLAIISMYYALIFALAKYFDRDGSTVFIVSGTNSIFYYTHIVVAFLSSFAFLSLFINEFEKKQKEVELKNTLLEQAVGSANQKSAEIELLLKELSHRTKNNLQLVSSIINIQSGQITDKLAKATIDDTRDRIAAMALLHQKLYVNDNLNTFSLSDYTIDLLKYLKDIFDDKSNPVKIITDVDKIEMKIDNAIHLGLVMNEILTNSFKHGMATSAEKFIKVTVKKVDDLNIMISIADSGKGITQIAQKNYSKSFGGSLIFSLVKQIEGEISFNEVGENEVIIRLKNIL
jgi:two-component sensor histidine kinase